ncbi:MAG: serine protease, partial [Verrucomicrobiota bacterium]
MARGEERWNNLRAMLKQVDPKFDGIRELKKALESSSAVSEGPVLDVAHSTKGRESISETLDVLIADQLEIDQDRAYQLEAIVMPFHRPVVDIVGGEMETSQLGGQWKHLGQGDVRKRIEALFPSVGRVEVHNHPSLPYAGTGFIVANFQTGRGLLMTNRHVVDSFATGVGERNLDFIAGRSSSIDFKREVGSPESLVGDRATFKVEGLRMIHPYWDMALLEVSGLSKEHRALTLGVKHPEDFPENQEVVAIGYPGSDPSGDAKFQKIQKEIFRDVYFVKRLQPGVLRPHAEVNSYGRPVRALTHDSSTLGGNSGSAIVTVPKDGSDPVVIGLHFAGAYLRANYAVSTHDLSQDSRVVDAGVAFDAPVIPKSAFYQNAWNSADSNSPELIRKGGSGQVSSLSIGLTDGGATWRLPIDVTVKLGAPTIVSSSPETSDSRFEGLFGTPPEEIPLVELATKFSCESLQATSFDWKTALSLAAASKLAYYDREAVESTATSSWGLGTCTFFEAVDTEGFIASTGKTAVSGNLLCLLHPEGDRSGSR